MVRLSKHYVPRTVLLLGLIDFAVLMLAAEGGCLIRVSQIGSEVDPASSPAPQLLTFALTLQLAWSGSESMAAKRCNRCGSRWDA